jgi:hypothetical protein
MVRISGRLPRQNIQVQALYATRARFVVKIRPLDWKRKKQSSLVQWTSVHFFHESFLQGKNALKKGSIVAENRL